jgi:nitrite reductase (NO-forming)
MKAGESVRLYLGNAGPALLSSFHIVGEIFDNVYGEGGTKVNQNNVQTTVVPVGGTAMVDLAMDVPGTYQFVDHSMFRAFNKGAMGAMQVEGTTRPEIFSGRQAEEIFNPGTHLQRVAAVSTSASDHGKGIYERICTTCHQPDGRGMPGVFPPLAQSDFLMENAERAVGVLLEGLQGPITVNGQTFNGAMPNFSLKDDEIAAVLSYVRNNFGNSGSTVTAADVKRVREAKDLTARSNR